MVILGIVAFLVIASRLGGGDGRSACGPSDLVLRSLASYAFGDKNDVQSDRLLMITMTSAERFKWLLEAF